MDGVRVGRATEADVLAVQVIAYQWRSELGRVMRPALYEAVARQELHVARIGAQVVGFVNWHGRRDGESTIYEIAVDKAHMGRGIGRALLWSVPAPIRLKVTQDNERANAFYRALNMRLVGTEAGRKRALNVYELPHLFIFCQGNNREIPRIASECGVAYGTRSEEKARAWPYMIDIHWQKYDWHKHMAMVREYAPIMACAADYLAPEQRDVMLAQVDDLRNAGVLRPVVIPKFNGAVQDIPADCIVGISVPSTYAGFVPNDDDVKWLRDNKRMVHLLGGTPKKQYAFLTDYAARGVRVVSVDSNSVQRASMFGTVFYKGDWHYLPNGQFAGGNMYESMKISIKELVQHYQQQPRQMMLWGDNWHEYI